MEAGEEAGAQAAEAAEADPPTHPAPRVVRREAAGETMRRRDDGEKEW